VRAEERRWLTLREALAAWRVRAGQVAARPSPGR